MKIRLKNLGILKYAEFSLGNLTIICGENNTGKTYAAYALYGFLDSWRELIDFGVSDAQIQSFIKDGALKIGLTQYVEKTDQMLAKAGRRYADQLDTVFAAPEGMFDQSEFHVEIGCPNLDKAYEGTIRPYGLPVTYSKRKGGEELTIAFVLEKEREKEINPLFAERAINFIIGNAIFPDFLPHPFISSVERTGVITFRRELDSARDRLLEEMAREGKNSAPRKLLAKRYTRYSSPIQYNLDFIHELADSTRGNSFIAKEHPEVLEAFADIIGGKYTMGEDDDLYYTPKGTQLQLGMAHSSSTVRSLVDIGFYLHHIAQKGDLLMVDEPELGLHPENQRRIARLFARLVNVGIKVFITTHSDYIVKELNTLIMLNDEDPRLKKLAKENGYRNVELITVDQIKVYTATKALVPLEEGQKRRRKEPTLVEADVDSELGIEAPSFDKTINKMNRIQRDIVWGGEYDFE